MHNLPDLILPDLMSECLKVQNRIPDDIYCVLSSPGLLAGSRSPNIMAMDFQGLKSSGFSWVVCLESNKPIYNCTPLFFLKCVELENLSLPTSIPSDPQKEEDKIYEIVGYVEEMLKDGEGVVISCVGGRGRTGTVIGCTLKRLGYDSQTIISYLNQLHIRRGKPGFPESRWQKKLVDRFI